MKLSLPASMRASGDGCTSRCVIAVQDGHQAAVKENRWYQRNSRNWPYEPLVEGGHVRTAFRNRF
jgi:hypothetical protein